MKTKVVAFFDMDETLLPYNTAPSWGRYLWQKKEVKFHQFIRSFFWGLQHRLALLDMQRLMTKLSTHLAGISEEKLANDAQEFIEKQIIPDILIQAQEAINFHRQQGHKIVMLTSSIKYLAQPVADFLNFDEVLCTKLEVINGVFTGKCYLPVCYGAGKVYYAEKFAEEYAIDLNKSYFYTDSYTDLPLLKKVGHPYPINPDSKLAAYSKKKGWPIQQWAPTKNK